MLSALAEPHIRPIQRKTVRREIYDVPQRRPGHSAVIMAGGYGTRLKHLTKDTPKPMVPVAGRPVLDHIIDHLKDQGVGQAAFSLHYLPEKVTNHFSDGKHGLDLRYAITGKNLGNAGGVRLAGQMIEGDPMFVFSGDVLADIDLKAMHEHHVKTGSHFTMAITQVPDPSAYGVAIQYPDGQLDRLIEKPGVWEGPAMINTGVYLMDRVLLDLIPKQEEYDFARNLIPALIRLGWRVQGFEHTGYWFDMGTPETLAQAESFLSAR